MQLTTYSFDRLPFTELFKTYVTDYSRLAPFYAADPFDPESVENYARNLRISGDSDENADLLRRFNERFDLHEAGLKNLERLREEDALAIVSGQQLGLLGGPLYTVLKIITTIHLSSVLESRLGRPVIPVFWLADEDHDFEEINAVSIPDSDEVSSLGLPSSLDGQIPVSRIKLSQEFESLKKQVKDKLGNTDFSDELWQLLDDCYQADSRMDRAFGRLIAKLFSKHGLILAGSNCKPIKKESKECLKLAVRESDAIRQALEEQSSSLEKEFHRQATVYDSNLFYLEDSSGRTKISRNGNQWVTDSGKNWTTDELLRDIDDEPERFSPNVFLRPLLQDRLVPTIGFVAGPGELAYYGQMKRMYELFDCAMPVIFPRMSATILEPAIERIIGELPFDIADYNDRIEDLESEYVDQAEKHDIEGIFKQWKQQVKPISETYTSEISEIDPTLEGAAGKATAVYFGELDKLKGKVYRSVKQQEETQLRRIRRIKTNLFPNGTLQERVISFIYYMNKYGLDVWDRLINELDVEEDFSSHKLIYL